MGSRELDITKVVIDSVTAGRAQIRRRRDATTQRKEEALNLGGSAPLVVAVGRSQSKFSGARHELEWGPWDMTEPAPKQQVLCTLPDTRKLEVAP